MIKNKIWLSKDNQSINIYLPVFAAYDIYVDNDKWLGNELEFVLNTVEPKNQHCYYYNEENTLRIFKHDLK